MRSRSCSGVIRISWRSAPMSVASTQLSDRPGGTVPRCRYREEQPVIPPLAADSAGQVNAALPVPASDQRVHLGDVLLRERAGGRSGGERGPAEQPAPDGRRLRRQGAGGEGGPDATGPVPK